MRAAADRHRPVAPPAIDTVRAALGWPALVGGVALGSTGCLVAAPVDSGRDGVAWPVIVLLGVLLVVAAWRMLQRGRRGRRRGGRSRRKVSGRD